MATPTRHNERIERQYKNACFPEEGSIMSLRHFRDRPAPTPSQDTSPRSRVHYGLFRAWAPSEIREADQRASRPPGCDGSWRRPCSRWAPSIPFSARAACFCHDTTREGARGEKSPRPGLNASSPGKSCESEPKNRTVVPDEDSPDRRRTRTTSETVQGAMDGRESHPSSRTTPGD